jgi:hypothetical protein
MLLSLLFSLVSFAAADSVAVFHRPEKVVVLLNEYRQQGRLHSLMQAWGEEKELFWQAEELYVSCARAKAGITCTLRLLPAGNARIEAKDSFWEGNGPAKDFAVSFESSRGHGLEFSSQGGRIFFHARRP